MFTHASAEWHEEILVLCGEHSDSQCHHLCVIRNDTKHPPPVGTQNHQAGRSGAHRGHANFKSTSCACMQTSQLLFNMLIVWQENRKLAQQSVLDLSETLFKACKVGKIIYNMPGCFWVLQCHVLDSRISN